MGGSRCLALWRQYHSLLGLPTNGDGPRGRSGTGGRSSTGRRGRGAGHDAAAGSGSPPSSRPTATPRRSSTPSGGRRPTPSWPAGPTPWPTASGPRAGWWRCASAPTSARSSPSWACCAAVTSPWWCRPTTRRWRHGSSRATTRTASSPGTATRSSWTSAAAGVPTTSTRTWPSCSAPRGRPARPSWCGSRHDNLESNATAIAAYLGLVPADRAALTLPLHYCYGLSVLHSHLAVGASVLVGAGSVVDPCFWERVRREQVTNLAGVPHTFELLDRAGFADHGAAVAPLRDPGRRPHGPRGGPPPRRAVPAPWPRPRRDVRPDRGHGPHGVPPSGAGHRRAVARSAGRSRVGRSGSTSPDERRRRGARLLGAERDARLRDRPGRPGAGPGAARAPDRRPRTGRRPWPGPRRRPHQPVRQAVRAAPRPRRDRAVPRARGRRGVRVRRRGPRRRRRGPDRRRRRRRRRGACGARWACPARPSSPSPTPSCPGSRPGSRTASGCSPMPGLGHGLPSPVPGVDVARPVRRRPDRPAVGAPRFGGAVGVPGGARVRRGRRVRHLRRPRRGLALLRRGGDGARGAPR